MPCFSILCVYGIFLVYYSNWMSYFSKLCVYAMFLSIAYCTLLLRHQQSSFGIKESKVIE